jgi:biopolymer transport protein ExbD
MPMLKVNNMKYKTFLLYSIMLLLMTGCANNKQDGEAGKDAVQKVLAADPGVIKVYVEQDGEITANGTSVSLTDLDSSFSKLKTSRGIIYYSRANTNSDPPPQSMKVMNLIIKHDLPVKLYTDKTFKVEVR